MAFGNVAGTRRKKAARRRPGSSAEAAYFSSSTSSDTICLALSLLSGWPWSFSTVTVLNDQGQPDNSDNARQIVRLLVDELK